MVQPRAGAMVHRAKWRDVFVHVSALERSGLTGLSEGQTVVVDVVEGRKGLEAARIRLAETGLP